ncbi:MAG: Ig-like domain repeat protein [Acidobacteriia bacterium]|nr:Ig-like domain repeat protein [Terriglobia bacterium]
MFAGMVALLNQYLGTNGLGNVNPNLYRMAQSTGDVFHDITSGNNFHLCKAGSPDCQPGHNSVGYVAEPGWDAVTGLGSVDGYRLITEWGGAVVATTTSVAASPASFTLSGQSTITATVKSAGSSITPTGTVSFTFGNTSLGTATLAGSGSTATASIILYGSQLTAGSDVINVTYSGDQNVNGSTGSVTVSVTVPVANSAVIPAILPNPVFQAAPDSDGYRWFYTIQLTEVAGTATTLTGLTIDGVDYSANIAAFFGTTSLPAYGTLAANLRATSLAVPLTRVFSFTGRDASGNTWTQQSSARFLGAQSSASIELISAPATVRQDPTQSSDCQYSQGLGIQEMNGHAVVLTRFLAAGSDYSNLLTDLFGSVSLAPFGSLQTDICWDLSGDTLPETLSYEIDGIDDQGNAVSAVSSAYFETAASNPGTLSTSADANGDMIVMTASDSTRTATASIGINVNSGQPWSITAFPSNRTTSWMRVYPLSGTGPATVTITAAGAGLSNGLHQATLVIQSVDALPEYTGVDVNFVVGQPAISSIVNAASLVNTGLAPGLMFAIKGGGLGPEIGLMPQLDENGRVSTNLSGVQVLVNGVYAPLLYVSQGQINAVAPYELAADVGGSALIQVVNNGVKGPAGGASVVATATAIFSLGGGQGAIVNSDGTVNGPNNPAARGSFVAIYATGEGQTNPPGIDGRIANDAVANLPRPAAPLSITIGNLPATYLYAGTAPGSFAGFLQVNAVIPANVAAGNVPVVITVGGIPSPPLNVAVK